ncbi:MAG: efflux RND transporter periplasmic adaptor subunit [Proteobacteria bacterium]|nr:efflux RND transporter periplasmic adaptor subunit [Pseudomonadota bacterium]
MSLLKQLLFVVLLGGLAYGGYLGWGEYVGANEAPPERAGGGGGAIAVETGIARIQAMPVIAEAVGTTLARQSIEIVPLSDGRIEQISFEAGQQVKAGDVLVRLDSDIERADLKQAEAALDRARLELDRITVLRQKNVATKATVDELASNLVAAEAAEARARRKLADRTIRAPFSGQTGIGRYDKGARVTDTTVITTLDDLSNVEIEFSVAEYLFAKTRLGQKVEATAAAYPDRGFTGTVTKIDSRVDPGNRSFKVRAEVPNPDGALPRGMFMYLRMTLAAHEVLVIPEEAIVAETADSFVFVVEDNKVQRRSISVGRREFGIAEVTDGLSPGAVVVTRGTGKLRNGATVKIATPGGEKDRKGSGGGRKTEAGAEKPDKRKLASDQSAARVAQ